MQYGFEIRELVSMSAISFEAVVINNAITIPEQFRESLHRDRVQVSIRDDATPMNKNHAAWQKFLSGLNACTEDEPIAFERADFGREIVL